MIALYDGHCRFCTREAKKLERLVGRSRLEARSFQEPGALDAFPGVTYEACMERLHVIADDGHVYAGAEAVARAVARVPIVGLVMFGYYVPGVRQVSDWAYARIAKKRYALFGKSEDCDPDGTCKLHGR
jgi:predicted DCC family thiol-disulfide oxidoreductase YuxK